MSDRDFLPVGEQYASHLLSEWLECEGCSKNFWAYTNANTIIDPKNPNAPDFVEPRDKEGIDLRAAYIACLTNMWGALRPNVKGNSRIDNELRVKFEEYSRFYHGPYLFLLSENSGELKNMELVIQDVLMVLGITKFKLTQQ